MARTSKKVTSGALRGRTPAQPPVVPRPRDERELGRTGGVAWTSNATVIRLTDKLLDLQTAAARRQCDAVVEMGRLLAEIHERLPHGAWLAWVDEAVPMSRSTITNYIGLARFAEQAPDDYARFKALGPTKVYQLANLAPNQRRRFHRTTPIVIPGGFGRKTLSVMTSDELRRVIVGSALAADTSAAPPIGAVLQTFRHRVAGMAAIVEQLRQRHAEVDRRQAHTLHAEVLEIARTLEAAFRL